MRQFFSGLKKVAKSKGMQCLRERQRHQERARIVLEVQETDPLKDWRSKEAQRVREEIVGDIVSRLSPQDKFIVEAIWLEKRKIGDVAAALGKSRNALDQKLFRLKLALKNDFLRQEKIDADLTEVR